MAAGIIAFAFNPGCSTPPVVTSASVVTAPATLTVVNQTDYRWQLTITRTDGERVRDAKVEPRATWVAQLEAGDYMIHQRELASDASAAGLARALPVSFVAGESYRWPIATLLSEPNTAADGTTAP